MAVEFDPLSVEFAQNPYQAYAQLRAESGLVWYEPHDTHLVARFADVAALVKDRSLVRTLDAFCSADQVAAQKRRDNWHDMPFHSRFVQFSMLDSDGSVHDRLRKQVFRFFGPAPIARMRPVLTEHIAAQVDAALERGQFDFVADLAAGIPGVAIGRLMGVPTADCEQIRQWSEQIVQYFDVDRSAARKALAESATQAFYEYLADLVKEREHAPRDDLLSQLLEVQSAGLISHDEFYSTCMLIVMAGHGSTLDVMGSGMHCLLRFPDQQTKLRNDPALTKTGIQEMFRYESPLPFFHRYASTPIVFHGTEYPVGTRFGFLYGAANRDPDAFPEPDQFDVSRWPNRHLAFGGGAHFCLGNHLARLSMDILFTQLLAKTRALEPAGGEPAYKTGLSVRGPLTLNLLARR